MKWSFSHENDTNGVWHAVPLFNRWCFVVKRSNNYESDIKGVSLLRTHKSTRAPMWTNGKKTHMHYPFCYFLVWEWLHLTHFEWWFVYTRTYTPPYLVVFFFMYIFLFQARLRAVQTLEALLEHGEEHAMNHFNKDIPSSSKPSVSSSSSSSSSSSVSIMSTIEQQQLRKGKVLASQIEKLS